MVDLHTVLRLVHILAMSVWLLAAAFAPGDARRTLARGKPHTDALGERVLRQVKMSQYAGVLTALTGLGLIFSFGGFAMISPRIHAGLGLALVGIAFEFLAIGPLASKLVAAAKEDPSGAAATKAVKAFAGMTGFLHLIRLVILVLMVLK